MMRQRLRNLDERFVRANEAQDHSTILRAIATVLAHSGDSWFWILGLGVLWWFGDAYWKHLSGAAGLKVNGDVYIAKLTPIRFLLVMLQEVRCWPCWLWAWDLSGWVCACWSGHLWWDWHAS
jgi:hypothetical protein